MADLTCFYTLSITQLDTLNPEAKHSYSFLFDDEDACIKAYQRANDIATRHPELLQVMVTQTSHQAEIDAVNIYLDDIEAGAYKPGHAALHKRSELGELITDFDDAIPS